MPPHIFYMIITKCDLISKIPLCSYTSVIQPYAHSMCKSVMVDMLFMKHFPQHTAQQWTVQPTEQSNCMIPCCWTQHSAH